MSVGVILELIMRHGYMVLIGCYVMLVIGCMMPNINLRVLMAYLSLVGFFVVCAIEAVPFWVIAVLCPVLLVTASICVSNRVHRFLDKKGGMRNGRN